MSYVHDPLSSPFLERDTNLGKPPRKHHVEPVKQDCWFISGRIAPPPEEGSGRNRFEIAKSRRRK